MYFIRSYMFRLFDGSRKRLVGRQKHINITAHTCSDLELKMLGVWVTRISRVSSLREHFADTHVNLLISACLKLLQY